MVASTAFLERQGSTLRPEELEGSGSNAFEGPLALPE
jgi:hypothetical protein